MTKPKIAFQGELGAYSHIAINEIFKDADIKTCSTFEETFKIAHEDESFKIVIPLENSLAGRVADIHYLLPKYKLQIHGEHFQVVEHKIHQQNRLDGQRTDNLETTKFDDFDTNSDKFDSILMFLQRFL